MSIARVLAAKDDLLLVEKTNSESIRQHTQSSINKVLIGKVFLAKLTCFSCIVFNAYFSP